MADRLNIAVSRLYAGFMTYELAVMEAGKRSDVRRPIVLTGRMASRVLRPIQIPNFHRPCKINIRVNLHQNLVVRFFYDGRHRLSCATSSLPACLLACARFVRSLAATAEHVHVRRRLRSVFVGSTSTEFMTIGNTIHHLDCACKAGVAGFGRREMALLACCCFDAW